VCQIWGGGIEEQCRCHTRIVPRGCYVVSRTRAESQAAGVSSTW
jgi:hypothetical protein